MIRPRQVDRVEEWLAEAVAGGGEAIAGNRRLGDTTFAPTVILDPSADCRLSTQEIFGPAIAVYGYDDLARPSGAPTVCLRLPGVVLHQPSRRQHAVRAGARCVSGNVNDHTAFRVDWMPFAGRRHSGYGVGGIGYTITGMTQEKMTVIRLWRGFRLRPHYARHQA